MAGVFVIEGDAELAALLSGLERVERVVAELRAALLYEAEGQSPRPAGMVAADLTGVVFDVERLVWQRAFRRLGGRPGKNV